MKRLARKKIGPRLLGTFLNGRFEQYLNASPLTPKDLRHPEVSKQIAKRMRELHDGIELTNEERSAGPLVWQNWDKWVKRCEEITSWLDEQIMLQTKASKSKADLWRLRGLVCGVPWASFRKAVENYRKWLDAKYHGKQGVRDELVFAHNDVWLSTDPPPPPFFFFFSYLTFLSQLSLPRLDIAYAILRLSTATSSASSQPANLPYSTLQTSTSSS